MSTMPHDVKTIPASPQKGKVRENKHWQAGWWDFQPLAERSLRPLEWSQSSIIFCAHPVQPLITARHFSSSKQFIIPSPTQVAAVPTSFSPPTLISVAPSDDWLFAYFPGRNVEGISCLWSRGSQIDNWSIRESWSIAQGAGPVASKWLGQPREWVSGTTPGSTMRLPPLGPRTPVSGPTLLIVTQDHNINVCYYRQYMTSLKFLTCSIAQPAMSIEGQIAPGDSGSTIKQCTRAAIGVGYNEYSLLIATRSHYVPPPLNITTQYSTIDPNLDPSTDSHSFEWENWGEDAVINLTEVQLLYNGQHLGLSTEPLHPLLGCDKTLINLAFISLPPSLEVPNPPPSPRKSYERLLLYLVSSYLDFEHYESPPKSELVAHSFTRLQSLPGPNATKSTWKICKTASRSFTPSVVAYVSPTTIRPLSGQHLIFAGVVDSSGSLPSARAHPNKARIGSTRVLNLSDLTDHADYETSPILCDVARSAQDMPLNAVLSPNGALLCTTSSSLWPTRTLVHSVPRLRNPQDASGNRIFPLVPSLANAIISGRALVDVSHALSLACTPFDDIVETLYQADSILDAQLSEFSHPCTLGILGAAIAIYRERALSMKSSHEDLTARWKTAHDLCSVISCNQAFDDCRDGDTYDLDAVWQLTGMSAWVISLTERLLKQCVMSSDLSSKDLEEQSPSSFAPPLDVPVLLHIGHPFALDNFIVALSHVQKFCAYIKSLAPRGESAQIARDIVVDLIGNSGIELSDLINSLEHTRQELMGLERESCRRALVSCQPTPDMYLPLSRSIRKVTQASVLVKPNLFIKPHDLVDGVGNLFASPKKDKYKDVLSKNLLGGVATSMTCLQCGGKTSLAQDISKGSSISARWQTWEKKWMLRCICGGRWKSTE